MTMTVTSKERGGERQPETEIARIYFCFYYSFQPQNVFIFNGFTTCNHNTNSSLNSKYMPCTAITNFKSECDTLPVWSIITY